MGSILGRYIESDPTVLHGQPAFRHTRIPVDAILEQVAAGLPWETMVEQWHGDVTAQAIGEAVALARLALLNWERDASEGRAQTRVYNQYIVADPAICHGRLTFRGTRLFVADILEQVAMGLAWRSISESWRGAVSRDAVAAAVKLAQVALMQSSAQLAIG